MLFGLLDTLDADKRAVFVLSELRGLTAPEIARITDTNLRTVYSRLRAARERFSAGLRRLHARETRHRRAAPRWAGAAWLARLLGPASPVIRPEVGLGALALGITTLGIITLGRPAPPPPPAPSTAAAQLAPSLAPKPGPAGLVPSAAPEPVPPPRPSPSSPPLSEAPEASPPARPEASDGGPRSPLGDDPELELLRQARTALREDRPTAALDLLDQHARRFPTSRFVRERRRTRLTALCRDGRTPEARDLARAWSLLGAC